MKVKIALLLEKITGHFWIIPFLITIALIGILLLLTSELFEVTDEMFERFFLVKSSSDGARLILSSIATALMTVVGVLFSIIIVVLQQMSSQYSPRVINNFTRSVLAQGVLGFYIGTFIYCLLLLMNIGKKNLDPDSIPQLALAFAVLLAIVCLVFLVIYVHFVTRSIQSTEIISRITRETIKSFHNVIKDRESCHHECRFSLSEDHHEITIVSKCFGYIDSIDWEAISEELPDQWDLTFLKAPGNFVQIGMAIMTIKGPSVIEKKVIEKIYEYIDITPTRTNSQDPDYGLQKLVDIALRALSPSVNDPSTAIESIHSITAIIAEQMKNPVRDEVVFDHQKRITFVRRPKKELIESCLDSIAKFGHSHDAVLLQLKKDLHFLKQFTEQPELEHFIDGKMKGLVSLQYSQNI